MKKAYLYLLLFLILAVDTLAISSVYESTSVSRIVGTPKEMQDQLFGGSLELKDAGYKGGLSTTNLENKNLIQHTFPDHSTTEPSKSWTQDTDKKLIVYESPSSNDKPNENLLIDTDYASSLDLSKKSLVIMNSQYSGLSLPEKDTFANKISPKATMIAPAAYESSQFLKTFLCNAGKNAMTVGETYRQARNNYHWNTADSSELIGLTLLSYMMYGNPLAKLTVPDFENWYRDSKCEDLMENFQVQEADQFSIAATETGFTKNIQFEISEHSIEPEESFELISTPETKQKMTPGELMLPTRTIATSFPTNTIITKIGPAEYSDPVEITANIPTWSGKEAMPRLCTTETQPTTTQFTNTYTENEQIALATINPIEIVDCAQGKFKLYKTIKYSIEYFPYSSLRITNVQVTDKAAPDTIQDVEIYVENTQTEPANGTLIIKNSQEQILSAEDITATKTSYTLELPISNQEGIHTYYAEFMQENESKTRWEFQVDVKTLEIDLTVPDSQNGEAYVGVSVRNNWESTISAEITIEVTQNQQIIETQTKDVELNLGENSIDFNFAVQKSGTPYNIIVTVQYQNSIQQINSILITNRAPEILTPTQTIKEAQVVQIDIITADSDGDQVTVQILNTPFPLDGTYTTTYEESGTYDILVEATDGIETVQKTIQLVIENTNRPPTLTVEETLNAKEGIELTLTPTTTDPDNENNVNNDDNELTILYGTPFNSEGKWTPEYDSPEQITVPVTVTDGEYEDTKIITINIENVNRPPTILTSEQINAKEAEEISVTAIAIDPDNENVYTHDDNELTFTYGTPFNTEGKWTPDYTSERTVQTTITVSDGEYQDSKTITIDVNNTNRQPTIQELTTTAAEGQSVTLTPTITDPDNEDNQPNDDNTLTILYETPFDANGTYTPDYDSPQQITTTITVTDGELNHTIVATINIQNTNRPPHLDALTDITINETQTVNAWLAKDPDNENTYAHDDNELTYRFYNVPLDNKGKWQTTYDNAGEYVIKVEANDGQYGITKEVKLIVTNVNRPPIITAPDQIMATKTADLSKYVTDPDNQNTATNDDNILKITYGPPFDTNGQWSPTQPTTAQTTITATDGTHTVQKTVYITILDTISPPTQTPPIEQITQQNDTQELPEVEITPEEEPVTIEEQNNTQAQNNTETPQEIEQNHIFITNAQQPIIATEQPQDDLQVKININGKQTNTGDTIKVKPEKDLKIKIDLENKAEQTKNIEITTEINNLDIEEQDNTKLETGETDKITQTIEIPRLTEKHEYPLTIFVNDDKTRTLNILLKIDKPTHEIKIRQFTVQEGYCDAEIKLKIENTGKNDEEIKITLLEETIETELEEGETRTISKTITKPGKYEIEAKIEYGKKELTETKTLELKPCTAETTTKTQAPPQEKSQTNLPIIHSTQTETIATKDIASITFIVLLTIFTGLLLTVAINKYQ